MEDFSLNHAYDMAELGMTIEHPEYGPMKPYQRYVGYNNYVWSAGSRRWIVLHDEDGNTYQLQKDTERGKTQLVEMPPDAPLNKPARASIPAQ